jgi:Sec-independent protein translocase protein TatA
MFGVSFSEILLIAILAIIILGPERIPNVGRVLGKTLRAYTNFKNDVSFDLKKSMSWSHSKTTNQQSKKPEPLSNSILDSETVSQTKKEAS